MLAFAFRRCLVALGVAGTVSIVSFLLLHMSGDLAAAIAGPEATAAQIETVRAQYGLNKSLVAQYAGWLWQALHFDFGKSFFFQDQVTDMIASRLPVTLTLGAFSILFAVAVGIPLGVIAALRANSWIDRLALGVAVFGQAMPSFFFGLALIVIFAVNLRWLPVAGADSWRHFILPVIALGYYAMPGIMRLTRNGMLEVMGADYIRTARAKGLRAGKIVFKHALRNAVIPVVALAAVQLGFMLGGSIVIEAVFSLHGIGHLAWEAIKRNDYPVMQAIVLLLAMIYIALTLAADLLNAALDPRLRTR